MRGFGITYHMGTFLAVAKKKKKKCKFVKSTRSWGRGVDARGVRGKRSSFVYVFALLPLDST